MTSESRLKRRFNQQSVRESLIHALLAGCAGMSVLTTTAIIAVLASEAIWNPSGKAFFQTISLRDFLFDRQWSPQFDDAHFGIMPLLCGTGLVAAIASAIGLPVGLAAAIYLSEYAAPLTRRCLKPALELLSGVPTIVYGYLALNFLTPLVLVPLFRDGVGIDYTLLGWAAAEGQKFWLWPAWGLEVSEFNALSGGIVVGIMIVPTVCSLSEDVLTAVPRSLREAAYALGSTKFDVVTRVVVPSALSGIMAAFLLAISRAIGETMAVTIASGNRPALTLNPLDQIQAMTGFIVSVTKGDAAPGSPEYMSLYAVALVLFLSTLLMNVLSNLVLARYREVYQ